MTQFEEFKGELEQKLEKFEGFRQKTNKNIKLGLSISKGLKYVYLPSLGLALASYAFSLSFRFTILFLLLSAIFFFVDMGLRTYVFKNPEVKFRNKFKTDIVAWVMGKLNENFVYDSHGQIPLEDIKEAGVFNSQIDRYEGEDYVKGKFDEVELQFCEGALYVDKVTFKSAISDMTSGIMDMLFPDGEKEEVEEEKQNLVKFYGGLMMRAVFPESHTGSVHVLPNKIVQSGLFKKNDFNGRERVEIGDVEFDKIFSVFTNEKLETHHILTKEFIQRINVLAEKTKGKIYISFVDRVLFLAIDWNKDLFEADLEKGIALVEEIGFVIDQLGFFEQLAKQLAENTQVWNK